MPFLKSPKGREPWKCGDELAQKTGILHTVYSINGDEYTGEWFNNKKHGIYIYVLANIEFKVLYSQRYIVLGLVVLVGLVGLGLPFLLRLGLVGLALWLVSGISLNKYRCEYGTLNSMFAHVFYVAIFFCKLICL